GGEFRIAKLLQQAEHVAVDGLFPDVVVGVEVAADADAADAGVERPRVQGQHPALAVADDADLRILATLLGEPVDGGEYLLQFVADQVPAQLERRAVEVLAVGQVGAAVALLHLAADERRHDDAAAALSEATGKLRLRRHALHQAGYLLGRLVGVGDGDDIGDLLLSNRDEQQALAVDVADGRPAHRKDLEAGPLADERRLRRGGDQLR